MADSIREKIVKNVVSALQAITIANGFDVDVAAVLRFRRGILQVNEFPTLLVNVEGEDIVPGPVGLNPIGTYTSDMRIVIACYIRQHETTAEEANKLLANVQKKLMEDSTRGGDAVDSNFTSSEDFIDDESEPRGGVSLVLEVKYRFLRKDPFTKG